MNFSPATALVAAGAFIGAALALSCAPQSTEAATPGAPESLTQAIKKQEATRVRTQPVELREMERSLSTTTVVESETEIQFFPRVAGVVVSLSVEEGDRVERGQVLARLDDREAAAALEDAQISLKEAREAVPKLELAAREAEERSERAKLAFQQAQRIAERNEKTGLVSQSDLEGLRNTRDSNEIDWRANKLAWDRAEQELKDSGTAIERAELAVARQELALSYTRLAAPFSGVIAKRTIKVGDSASPSMAAFVLTDPDRLRAIFHRPQREFSMFQTARLATESDSAEPLEIRVKAEAYPELTFGGSIELVSPTVSADSGSFRVTVALDPASNEDPSVRLLPGMLVRLAIVTDRHAEALVIPKRALRREGDRHFLFVAEAGHARRVDVESGFSTDEDIEVVPLTGQELVAGAAVIVIGNRDLEDGSPVNSEEWSADGVGAEAAEKDAVGTSSADASGSGSGSAEAR